MKKYLTLVVAVILINTSKAQTGEKFDAKFIYEKLVDIYHKSLTINEENYYSQFGFGYGYLVEEGPDGSIIHPSLDKAGDKEFSFTTHSLSNSLYTTIESRYSTRSRKEYKNLLIYIQSIGYKLVSDNSRPIETQTYQMDKMQLVFQKSGSDDPRPYKIIYSLNTH